MYFYAPIYKTYDSSNGELISSEWGMLDGEGEVVSAVASCPLGLKTKWMRR